jgi:alpha-beta hydrolase superfamily lysophospholipase
MSGISKDGMRMPANDSALSMSAPAQPVMDSEDAVSVRDGTALHTYRWTSRAAEQQSGAVILIAHGYSEYGRRYDRVARYLVSRGHPVYAYDARGHGFSPGQRGYIDGYARYVDDCTDVAREIGRRYPQRPLVLLGHSNGGLTALRTVQRGESGARGIVVTCPMVALQPKHKPLPRSVAGVLAAVFPRLSLPNGINQRELSHDTAINESWSADPMNHGKTTPRWFVGALDAMAEANAEASKVTLPILALRAELDSIVDPKGVGEFMDKVASADRELVTCAGAFHEVLQEVDRDQNFKRIADWLASRFGG